jgi:hypothetical protein
MYHRAPRQQRLWPDQEPDLSPFAPLPAVMRRYVIICVNPTVIASSLDQLVNIHAVERFLGDEAIRQGWQFESTSPSGGKHVLVIGAGPSGLAAAYHLRRFGHRVTIYDLAIVRKPEAVSLLRGIEGCVTPMLGRRVLIYGGGKARRCPYCGNCFECDNCCSTGLQTCARRAQHAAGSTAVAKRRRLVRFCP